MNKSFITLLKENWLLIVVISQFILTFGLIQTKVNEHETKIQKLEDSKTLEALNIAEINSRLASIETSLVFIKEALK